MRKKEHARDAESIIIKAKLERERENMRAGEKNRKKPGVQKERVRAWWHREKSK